MDYIISNTSANSIILGIFSIEYNRLLRNLVKRNFVGWFNLAAAIQVEFKKSTRFIFFIIDIKFTKLVIPTMSIESTKPVLSIMRKPFCDMH